MISVDRNAKDIESVLTSVLEKKSTIRSFVVVAFDYMGNADVRYAADWREIGIAASLCQAEFQRCYDAEES